MMPSSPRGWFCWAVHVSEQYTRPRSPKYEYEGISDHRTSDRREAALSVKMLAERASVKCSGNGEGYGLMMRFYVDEASWWDFTDREQTVLKRTIGDFSRRLVAAGFLPDLSMTEEALPAGLPGGAVEASERWK